MSGEYDLTELCRTAGVTQRTVRYYIQQGLLEPPDSRGPKARYGEAHLQRLRLIKRLQRRHLPLAEIRRMLDELDEASVEEALGETASAQPSSALEYIAALRASSAQQEPWQSREVHVQIAASAPPADVLRKLSAPQVTSRPPAESRGTESFGRRSQWERITLAANVELQLRRPLSRAENRAVERLLETARELFAEEQKEEP